MVTQILNFGLPAQIDVRTVGYDRDQQSAGRAELQRRIAAMPGVADAHLQQEVDAPAFLAKIDRARAAQLGLTANAIANNLNISLSSSEQVAPNFWTDPANGIPYYIAVQTPEHACLARRAWQHAGLDPSPWQPEIPCPACSATWRRFKREACRPIPTRPISSRSTRSTPAAGPRPRRRVRATSRRSSPICRSSSARQSHRGPRPDPEHERRFRDLAIGLLFAAVFVYLLMVVNYQNFGDPFVVILALPATFCGIVTMLFITGTTLMSRR